MALLLPRAAGEPAIVQYLIFVRQSFVGARRIYDVIQFHLFAVFHVFVDRQLACHFDVGVIGGQAHQVLFLKAQSNALFNAFET